MKARGIAIGIVLFLGLAVMAHTLLPTQESVAAEGRNLGYVYSGARSQCTTLVTSGMEESDMLLFGSSELSTPPSLIPEVPAVVFGKNSYGFQLATIGEAYDQSLWHAIAAGAYAPQLPNRKVAIVVSPSWFFDGGLDASLFKTRFSYTLYRQFMSNEHISAESKAYVRDRLVAQGIDEVVVKAAAKGDPLAYVNDVVFSTMADLHVRNQLRSLEGLGLDRFDDLAHEPDFERWRAHAIEDAQERSTNEWGFDDAFYEENVGIYKDQIKGKLAGETFTDTPEYDDFGLFLRICQETGLEPLVVVCPLSGDYYDWVGIDAATRRVSYDHILEIANAYGVEVADFSDREYERYFLHDQVHFGWTGWVDVEEALYRFAKGDTHG